MRIFKESLDCTSPYLLPLAVVEDAADEAAKEEIFAAEKEDAADADVDKDAEWVVVVVEMEEKGDANHGMIGKAEVETEAGTASAAEVADVEVVVKEAEVMKEIMMEIILGCRNPPEVTKLLDD